jgi:hypothetical protein
LGHFFDSIIHFPPLNPPTFLTKISIISANDLYSLHWIGVNYASKKKRCCAREIINIAWRRVILH